MSVGADIAGLFTPLSLNNLVLPNRFVMPGMQRGWNDAGAPRRQLADYYRRRVDGGVGLIIGESCAVAHPTATAQAAAAKLTPETVGAWRRCADAVHRGGGVMLIQLWHEGGVRNAADGLTRSPSGFGRPGKPNGTAASGTELDEICAAFAESAALAKSIGVVGVEIHACHGYLLDQFLWSDTNRRDDGQGGDDIRDRVRFPARVVAAIRAQCGPQFLISFRFSQWKETEYSARIAQTPQDLQIMLEALKKAGVDLFHASTRRFWTPEWLGDDRGLAGWTKHLSGMPTIAVGSVGLSKDVMETFLEPDEAQPRLLETVYELSRRFAAAEFDLVSVGRSLIADPDWVSKIKDGRYAEIRPFQKADIATLEWEREA